MPRPVARWSSSVAATLGHTLLQNMLNSHPEVFGGPELIHIKSIMWLRRQFLITDQNGWTGVFYSSEKADRLFSRMILELLIPLADNHGARLISEKTPVNVLVFRDLLELFPAARCIQVVRDPRAVVASMLRAGQRARGSAMERQAPRDAEVRAFTTDVRQAITYVQRCYRAGFAAIEAVPERCLTVHYEKLVADPAGESRRVCDFLGLSWSETMTRPGEKEHMGEAQMTAGFGSFFYDRNSYRRNPDPMQTDRWRSQLTLAQKALIISRFANFEYRDRLPYDLSPSTLSAPERALAVSFR